MQRFSTNMNESYHGTYHGKYEVGGKGNLAPKVGPTQNQLAACVASQSHSLVVLELLKKGGLPKEHPIAKKLREKGLLEQEKRKKQRDYNVSEARKRRRSERNKKMSANKKEGKTMYKSEIEMKKKEEGKEGKEGKEGEEGEEGEETPKPKKRKTSCSQCGQSGHNKRTCPINK